MYLCLGRSSFYCKYAWILPLTKLCYIFCIWVIPNIWACRGYCGKYSRGVPPSPNSGYMHSLATSEHDVTIFLVQNWCFAAFRGGILYWVFSTFTKYWLYAGLGDLPIAIWNLEGWCCMGSHCDKVGIPTKGLIHSLLVQQHVPWKMYLCLGRSPFYCKYAWVLFLIKWCYIFLHSSDFQCTGLQGRYGKCSRAVPPLPNSGFMYSLATSRHDVTILLGTTCGLDTRDGLWKVYVRKFYLFQIEKIERCQGFTADQIASEGRWKMFGIFSMCYDALPITCEFACAIQQGKNVTIHFYVGIIYLVSNIIIYWYLFCFYKFSGYTPLSCPNNMQNVRYIFNPPPQNNNNIMFLYYLF